MAVTKAPHFTSDELKEIVVYEPDTGLFRWVRDHVCKKYLAGTVAGHRGIRATKIMIDRRGYAAHRLAWYYVHGYWPSLLIDHINGDCYDNRITNLREATHTQNQANKCVPAPKSGYVGVKKNARCRTFCVYIRINGKLVSRSGFLTAKEAHEVYLRLHREHHGSFSGIRMKNSGSGRANGLPVS